MALTEINSLGVKDGEIKTDDILDANVTLAKVENVTDGQIIVGNGSNRPTAVTVSGDITLANTGAVTIAAGAVEHAMLDDDCVDGDNIADNSVGLAALAGIARGKIIYGDASGDPALLAVGSNGQVLKSDGTDIAWADAAAGATGAGSDKIFWENGTTVTQSYTIAGNASTAKNAMSAGPITINDSVVVTIGANQTWTIV